MGEMDVVKPPGLWIQSLTAPEFDPCLTLDTHKLN